MIRVAIITPDGKPIPPQEIATATELGEAVEQARRLIRDCESVARLKAPSAQKPGTGAVPYLN
jgi:hypothetical protein